MTLWDSYFTEISPGKPWEDNILVCQGCFNKIAETEYLNQEKFIVLSSGG